jgi:hypothetical protein
VKEDEGCGLAEEVVSTLDSPRKGSARAGTGELGVLGGLGEKERETEYELVGDRCGDGMGLVLLGVCTRPRIREELFVFRKADEAREEGIDDEGV